MDSLPLESIDIRDIAHSLSLICRFIGHSDKFYCVAEHSIMVANELRHQGYDAKMQFVGLMHDATEAYLGDVPTPLKCLLPYYKEIENKFYLKIAEKYGLPTKLPEEVKIADGVLLATEAEALMGGCADWNLPYGPSKLVKIGDITLSPSNARDMFLNRFRDLQIEMRGGIHE